MNKGLLKYLLVAIVSVGIGYLIALPQPEKSIPVKQQYFKEDVKFIMESESYLPDSGFIPNAEVAASVARVILNPIYHEKYPEGFYFNVSSIGDSLWLVVGNRDVAIDDKLIEFTGNPYVLIGKNGEIVKIVHTK